ncbi:MAG: ABC transporter ATP-binding protein [Candidatus Nitronauta litoralis]|uniref:ABC transporter ATP-binding protein n=1 Tax=Candidatus Nitronauta litoralis TaxID=2705533 RepID=A0A7T0BY06_9BACT|nr:MAG: ABC transporter ATP-binding protein [Candidatus Nitronauta litoralis]
MKNIEIATSSRIKNEIEKGGIPLLNVQDLSFSYTDTPVLRGIAMSIHPGEWVGVIGPNGSGKSTLIKLLGGLLKAPFNSIQFHNKSIEKYSRLDLAREIAWVPQETATPFSFTAYEMVMMGRHPYLKAFRFESQEDHDICHRAMEVTSTTEFKARKFSELSGGEKQRVLIASAIVQSPKIMLLDEPTASLDLKYQVQVLDILERLNIQRGITLALAMHDLNLATKYCHRLVLIKEGRIICDGPPETVLQKEIIEEVYEVKVQMMKSPKDGTPLIFPESA